MKRHRPGSMVLAALLVAAVGSGCAAETGGDSDGSAPGQSARPAPGQQGSPARKGAPAQQGAPAERAVSAEQARGPADAMGAYAEELKRKQAVRAAVAKKWGLAKVPLTAPAPPAVKPHITTRKGFEVEDGDALPPVFTSVPTQDRVVFLTMDDGEEKDPELLRMMTELGIPYSAFLSDYLVSDDYGYFKEMRSRGVSINNHTLNHRYLPGLSAADQKKEICDQQDRIEKHIGKRPTLFRPPYGNYNRDTLRIAQSCGIKAVPLWTTEAFPDHLEWRGERKLHPGDIILTHFRGRGEWKGSMADLIRRVMKTVTDEGYAVARLEDYV